MLARAEKVGITIDRQDCGDDSEWLVAWNAGGWWESTADEMEYFHLEYGVVSFEIDNLYRAGVDSAESLLSFLKKFQDVVETRELPVSLVLKNPTVDDLAALREDLDSTQEDRVRTSTLTRFAISEEFFQDDWPAIKAASLEIGITTLLSADTNDYQAKGYFGE